jgi:hypothetical protein
MTDVNVYPRQDNETPQKASKKVCANEIAVGYHV